jgi:hypothetical protein
VIVIPIVPATLDLVEVLNDGLRPKVEAEETFFIFRGKNRPGSINTLEQIERIEDAGGAWIHVQFLLSDM